METTTVRVSSKTHSTLKKLAGESHEPIQLVLDKAVEEYRRKRMMEAFNNAYAALRADPVAWQELQEERAVLEGSLTDHLPEE